MRHGKPVIFATVGMLFGAAAVLVVSHLAAPAPQHLSSQRKKSSITADAQVPIVAGPRSFSMASPPPSSGSDTITSKATHPSPATPRIHTVKIEQGDTLMGALISAGVERQDAHSAIEALRSVYDPRSLRVGDEITVTFDEPENQHQLFQGFSLEPSPAFKVQSSRSDDGSFSSSSIKTPLNDEMVRIEGDIGTSLFAAAGEAGVPVDIIQNLINIFSYDVDFQRDIQKGDRFALLIRRKVTPRGEPVGDAVLLYAAMTLSGRTTALWRHESKDGRIDYFNSKGESVRKALLRTPINGARLTSGFGTRVHPVLGYSRMHKGVDFAAPRGTPIYAAGDGVIEIAGFKGSYGNYVRLRHNNEYATAYAHMSAIGKGIATGKRVRQGEVIGYVGTTGRSTGPHLHYEIIKKGKQVNPLGVKFPTGNVLAGAELRRFQGQRATMEKVYADLPVGMNRKLARAH
ncbi:M23 family metallopeptidase [Haematospirillum jordaniae]|uniref:Uncharacterized protein n=1 Tax=Haematospirillum jordaniae TaxID=1549855 RepID=A0A143DEK2_9PROT|nr:M23 family metallopeptidase [Haematospirillum jordaniae]AMW34950.1 hypothetical protein AY555_06865 [Haematospirillum jordaniae]